MATKKGINKKTAVKTKKEIKTESIKDKKENAAEKNTFSEEKYFTVSLDTFLYNAGIIGFIKVLETLKAKKGTSPEDKKDYFIHGQCLYVCKDYLAKADLAEGYIEAVCEKFGDKTKIYSTIENIEHIIETKKIDDESDKEKSILETNDRAITKSNKKKNRLENIIESLTAASIKTGCDTMNAIGVRNSIQENIEKISKQKDDVKFIIPLLSAILQELKKDEIKKTLFMKNIIYTKIKLFWDNKSFLLPANSKYSIKNVFAESFEKPLKDSIINCKTEKYNCITCGESISKDIDTTFLFEVGVDTGRKKSAFWNQNPDAFLCPLCNFIYSCSPIGFIDMDSIMIFVNQNDSIETIKNMNVTVEFADEKNKKYNFYNTIIQRALAVKTKELSSLQVTFSLNWLFRRRLDIEPLELFKL